MEEDSKLLMISLVVGVIIVGGLIYSSGSSSSEEMVEIDDPNWCMNGTNVSVATGEIDQINNTSETVAQEFQVIGKTNYKNRELCQAEFKYNNETIIQYSSKKNDYIVIAYKDENGSIVNEVEIDPNNQTTQDDNQDGDVWEGWKE